MAPISTKLGRPARGLIIVGSIAVAMLSIAVAVLYLLGFIVFMDPELRLRVALASWSLLWLLLCVFYYRRKMQFALTSPWLLVALASLVSIGAFVAVLLKQNGSATSDWERLEQLGLTDSRFAALPVDKQIETLSDIAHFPQTHPSDALTHLGFVMREKASASPDLLAAAIRSHLPGAARGDVEDQHILEALVLALYNTPPKTETELRLAEDLACNPQYRELTYEWVALDLISRANPQVLLGEVPPDGRLGYICRAIGWPATGQPKD